MQQDTGRDLILKVLKVFSSLGKVAANFGLIGALISFIFAFIPQSNPMFESMKEQFAEVSRKLDSLSLQISTLQTEMEWANYASSYGKDENVIKNSWAKLTEFIKTAPVASTQEQKTRLAERFSTFYENTGTENSIANFYRYITENNPVSLNKNLLQLITEKSNGDFNVLVQYTTYFTTLMVTGLQLNVFYHKLKGYDGKAKAQEAVTQLSNTLSAIQDALIECANSFETWAYKDALKLSNQPFSSTEKLATDIKKHLESKFHLFNWIVIAHSNKDEFTFGKSITFDAQEKTSVHLIHREKGSTIDQYTKANIQSSFQNEIESLRFNKKCLTIREELLHRLGAKVISHIQFLHAVKKPLDYAQTDAADVELTCDQASVFFRDFSIFLKGKVVTPSCSDVNCKHGECKPIKDTAQGFCKCHTMFYGPTCEESIQDMINYEALEGEIMYSTCLVHPCGVDKNRFCQCVSPRKGDPYLGCKSPDLKWIQSKEAHHGVVRSKTGAVVCKAIGPDGGWHSGFVKDEKCYYEYDWRTHEAGSYEVLVDPCEGRGYKWVEGAQKDMYTYDNSRRFPGVHYYVCSLKHNGYVGKLFNTRQGFLCHFPLGSNNRDENFYALVTQPCL